MNDFDEDDDEDEDEEDVADGVSVLPMFSLFFVSSQIQPAFYQKYFIRVQQTLFLSKELG